MTTTTKVEGITIHDDGEDRETTHYTNDDDLTVNIRKGWDMGGGHRQGIVLVQLGIDDYDCHEDEGNPANVLDQAISTSQEKDCPRRARDTSQHANPSFAGLSSQVPAASHLGPGEIRPSSPPHRPSTPRLGAKQLLCTPPAVSTSSLLRVGNTGQNIRFVA